MIQGPVCINCEQKKQTKYLITMNDRSGFICEECYKTNLWAYDGDNLRYQTLLNSLLHTKLFNMKKGGT